MLLLVALPYSALAQMEVVGLVVDELNSEPLEFVNVYFEDTDIGTYTDEDGYFKLTSEKQHKAVIISFVGYEKQRVKIKSAERQTITVKLKSELVNLDEVVVMSGENPSFHSYYSWANEFL